MNRNATLSAAYFLLVLALSYAKDSSAEQDIPANQPAKNEAAWQLLSNLRFPVDTAVAFEESRKTRLQRKPKHQQGELSLSSDGDLAMRITSPRKELRQISGNILSLSRGTKTRSTTLDRSKGSQQLLVAIVDLLSGDISGLKSKFAITSQTDATPNLDSGPYEWAWKLIPLDNQLAEQIDSLLLSGNGNQLLELRAQNGSSFHTLRISHTSDAPGP